MSENAEKYRRALDGFAAVVDQVPDSKWSAAAPCEGWTAAHVVGHVIAGSQMVSATRTGDAPNWDQLAAAGDDPAASFRAARDAALATLTPEHLGAMVQSPAGEIPLDQALGMFLTNDVLIHTWDLAQAVGAKPELDQELVEQCYAALQPIDEMIRRPGVFGPKIEPPADADMTTKLMCFVGRKA